MSSAFDLRGDQQQAADHVDLETDLEAEHRPDVSRQISLAGLRQVQKKASGERHGDKGGAHVHDAAARGTASATTSLPHADKLQAAFGEHDLSHIKAHVGGSTAAEMGASAYASGSHVVFDRAPDLHTAAHEVAHVVQQARGVNLYGGVGEAGDQYEQQADAIADRVVAGQSAADLLGAPQAGAAHTAAAVQQNAVQLDKGSAKPAEATDAERKKGHEHAEIESAGAMGSTIMLAARRMFSASRHIDFLSRQTPNDGGGTFQIKEAMRQEVKEVQADLVMLEMFLAGFETRGSGDASKDGKIDGAHAVFADKLKYLKRAYNEYRQAFYLAKNYGDKSDALGARDLDTDLFPYAIKPAFEKFDLKFDDISSTQLDFKDGRVFRPDEKELKAIEKLDAEYLDTAVKDNLDAALASAQALHLEVKAGSKGERSNDARQLAAHVRELAHIVGDQDKAHKKAHHGQLKALLKEIDAVMAEHGDHEEVKTVLMNPAGTFSTNLGKLKAAMK